MKISRSKTSRTPSLKTKYMNDEIGILIAKQSAIQPLRARFALKKPSQSGQKKNNTSAAPRDSLQKQNDIEFIFYRTNRNNSVMPEKTASMLNAQDQTRAIFTDLKMRPKSSQHKHLDAGKMAAISSAGEASESSTTKKKWVSAPFRRQSSQETGLNKVPSEMLLYNSLCSKFEEELTKNSQVVPGTEKGKLKQSLSSWRFMNQRQMSGFD